MVSEDKDNKMILLAGIHCVGKSFFCELVKRKCGILSFSASKLISAEKKQIFRNDKLIKDIDLNQYYLLRAINNIETEGAPYILDGHLCLLDEDGIITRIPEKTFLALNPSKIVLLMERPEVISLRRQERDGIYQDEKTIQLFQDEEKQYAECLSRGLGIPLLISRGAGDLDCVISKLIGGGVNNGRHFSIKENS